LIKISEKLLFRGGLVENSHIFNAYAEGKEGIFDIFIKSCGHIFAEKGREINRPYGRDDWLLFYIAKGKERFYLDEEVYADEGSFIFFRPRERQRHIYLGEQTGEFYYVHFMAPLQFDLLGFKSFTLYSSSPTSLIKELFEEVINELQMKKVNYEKICLTLFLNIICHLQRRMENSQNPHKKYLNDISSIVQIMNREYEKDYSLEDYAEMCHMSKFHFLRMFKNIVGCTPHEYLANIRIDHAAEFLEDTALSVNEIAARTGFASQSYFCDAFKKKTGKTPSAHRENKT